MRQHLDVEDKDYPPLVDTLGERVAAERVIKGWSQARLAEEVSRRGFRIGQSGIGNLEKRGDSQPKCISQLATALGVTVEWLQTGKGVKVAASQTQPNGNKSDIDIVRGVRPLVAATEPLVIFRSAIASGRAGEILIYKEKAGAATRPVELEFSKEAFAFRVIDDSSSPVYEVRDLLLIDPSSPPAPGDDCLMVQDPAANPSTALLRRVVKITPTHWVVRAFAPGSKDAKLERSTWAEAWPVFGKYNRR